MIRFYYICVFYMCFFTSRLLNNKTKKSNLTTKLILPIYKSKQKKNGNQPPKNKIDINALIANIFEYSANENKANVMPEYSTLYPETNSASASGKSNGCLLVSANAEIKKIKKRGLTIKINQSDSWAIIIEFKLNEPANVAIEAKIKPKEIS